MSSTITGGDQAKAAREQKHVSLLQSIQNLNEVKRQLQDLLEKINGPEPPSDKAEKAEIEKQPTLAAMLDRAPNNINRLCEQIRTTIHSIDEVLF